MPNLIHTEVGDTLELKLESAHLQALSVKHTLRHLGNELDEKIAAKNTLIVRIVL